MDDEYRVNFDHYDIGPIYYKDNRRCLFDPIREKFIFETQEEIIRQKFIKFLIDELKVPRNMIGVEVPLSRYRNGVKARADIVVFAKFDPGEITPVIIVECKAPNVPLIDNVWYQVDKYDEILGAGMVIITNGVETFGGYYDNDNADGGYRLIQNLPTYQQVLDGEVEVDMPGVIYPTWHRPPFDDLLSEENINDFIDYGWIGEDTDRTLYPLIMNLAGFFNDQDMNLLPMKLEGFNVKEEGVRHTNFGNAGGGKYDGDYKYFIIEGKNKNDILISFGIFGTAKTVDDPFWGTRAGNTTLIVGTNFNGEEHSSLQLNIDRFTTITKDLYELWHDGRLTVGNLGAAKRDEVIEFIKSREPSLVDQYNRIVLGNLNRNVNIRWEQQNAKLFFRNLTKYAILRDEFRAIKKKSHRKKKKIIIKK